MQPAGVIILVLIVGSAIIALIVYGVRTAAERERKRLAALAGWALSNGFYFYQEDLMDLDARFDGLYDIGAGHDRYAYEVLYCEKPARTYLFQYHYSTTETKTVKDSDGHEHTETEEVDHYRRYLVIELGAKFPSLSLRHENWMDKLAGLIGFEDINFESEEFSRKYYCKSDNREFAYALIHPQMIQWLLQREFVMQMERGLFTMDLSGDEHAAAQCQQELTEAATFIDLIPPFVWQDYGKVLPIVFKGFVEYVPPPEVTGMN